MQYKAWRDRYGTDKLACNVQRSPERGSIIGAFHSQPALPFTQQFSPKYGIKPAIPLSAAGDSGDARLWV